MTAQTELMNRPGFELTPRSWTVAVPPTKRCFSATHYLIHLSWTSLNPPIKEKRFGADTDLSAWPSHGAIKSPGELLNFLGTV
jgi:hypothetical protein